MKVLETEMQHILDRWCVFNGQNMTSKCIFQNWYKGKRKISEAITLKRIRKREVLSKEKEEEWHVKVSVFRCFESKIVEKNLCSKVYVN